MIWFFSIQRLKNHMIVHTFLFSGTQNNINLMLWIKHKLSKVESRRLDTYWEPETYDNSNYGEERYA
jgi:hypothetical protein